MTDKDHCQTCGTPLCAHNRSGKDRTLCARCDRKCQEPVRSAGQSVDGQCRQV